MGHNQGGWTAKVKINCPHCCSIPAVIKYCCYCKGTKQVDQDSLEKYLINGIWARYRCNCDACNYIEKHLEPNIITRPWKRLYKRSKAS